MHLIKHFLAVTLGVTLAMLTGSLLTQQPAKAENTKALRGFYLTSTDHTGSQASTACAAGFHMASLWEIFDPSNLRYETALGLTLGDTGSGPPSGHGGWIRTGFEKLSQPTFPDAGTVSCNGWTSSDVMEHGSVVRLPNHWDLLAGTAIPVSPWGPQSIPCNQGVPVWCVED